ncbi:MAG: DUF4263 domain-containing protein [Prolixibacteraceae bacterium]|nr:DUF4263 domain-containing protein [Prolixibacteraceae bacterium]
MNKNLFVVVKKTFRFQKKDLFSEKIEENLIDVFNLNDSIEFIFGNLVGEYFKIDKNILRINQDLYLYQDLTIKKELFIAHNDISIITKIGKLIKGDIYIGGNYINSLPSEEMDKLIRTFPNSYEIKKYVEARLSVILNDYFDNITDAKQKYDKYMNTKVSAQGINLIDMFKESELTKYITIRSKLSQMLNNEVEYNEKRWQIEILQILLLLFPKYIFVFKEVKIKDIYSNKNRYLDYLLVDSTGTVDIVEIKKPFDSCIVTKNQFRDNYIPMKELSGTVMQIEKYIFYLNKWGKSGEDYLTDRYKDKLPNNFRIKITNPNGIIVMGRESGLSEEQLLDFEVIKRKYKNVVDIITYDDMIGRLNMIIEQLNEKNFE